MLYIAGLVIYIAGLVIFYIGEELHEVVQVRSNCLTGEHLICVPAGIFDCSTVRSSCHNASVKVQNG